MFKEIGKPQQCKHKPHRNKYAEIKHHQLDCKCNQAWSIPFQNTSRLYLPRLKQLSVELVAGFADFSKGTKFGKPRVRMQNPGQRKLLFMAHRPSDQLSPRVVLYSFCVHFSIPLDKPPLLRVAHWAPASFQDCKGTRHSKRTNRCAHDVHRILLGFGSYDVFPNQRNLQGNGQVQSESQRRQEERFRVPYVTGRAPWIGGMQAYWIGGTALGRRICRSAIKI